MRGMVTVLGKDSVGINARTGAYMSAYMARKNIKVLDTAQGILGGRFSMMMTVDLGETSEPLSHLAEGLEILGRDIGVVVRIHREDIFNVMHRI